MQIPVSRLIVRVSPALYAGRAGWQNRVACCSLLGPCRSAGRGDELQIWLAVVGETSPFHSWKDNERFRRLGITFKRLVAKVKEEVLYGRMGFWPDHKPVVRYGLQFEIAQ